jgi:hypothetical protein
MRGSGLYANIVPTIVDDLGCVKRLDAIVGAQQGYETRSVGESFVRKHRCL